MRKIGLTLLTLTIALAACGEVPTAASADDARAAMDTYVVGSGSYEVSTAENPGLLGSGHLEVVEAGMELESTSGGPGFLGSGH